MNAPLKTLKLSAIHLLMSSKAALLVLLLASGVRDALASELAQRTLEVPILVEDLTTSQPAGLVPVTGALGTLELRRAIVVDTLAPSNPAINDLWIDSSAGGMYRTCIYTGSGWVQTDGSGESCGTIFERTLMVASSGSGLGTLFTLPSGIACGADCVQGFTLGEVVQLFAVPDADSVFLAWSGCSSELATSITLLMEEDRSCTAQFATAVGIAAADWSPSYTLYYDFDSLLAASPDSALKLVANQGTAGNSCDLRQYGSNLPLVLSASSQQGGYSLNLQSTSNGINQRLGVRMQSDPANGSCDAARLGNPGPSYGTFTYHVRFRPELNNEPGATISRVSEVANGGPGGWAIEWQETGAVIGRAFNGNSQSALVSENICPAGAWCVASLVFDDTLDTFCLYVNGAAAGCTGLSNVSEPPSGSSAYYRFGNASNGSKLNGLVDESGLLLAVPYDAESVCRVCSCGIDGSLCSCDPIFTDAYAAAGGEGLNTSQCGSCQLPACDLAAP